MVSIKKIGNSLQIKFARFIKKISCWFEPVHSKESSNRFLNFFYPGHYYTPIPDPEFIKENESMIFRHDVPEIRGIHIDSISQVELTARFMGYLAEYVPPNNQAEAMVRNARFHLDNPFFNGFDAFAYIGMLRHFKPKRVVEVGSGFTSALALDVRDNFLSLAPEFTFIEPFPERLVNLLSGNDKSKEKIIQDIVQKVGSEVFLNLEKGDILFIDSSHVSKVGSDVNFLLLEVLPRLRTGVVIHIHDIFWPFEYPKAWFDEGRSWTEAYLLRGILTHSIRYKILYFNSYLSKNHPEVTSKLPEWVRAGGAQSIWLEVIK
jgi:hypothetical protein